MASRYAASSRRSNACRKSSNRARRPRCAASINARASTLSHPRDSRLDTLEALLSRPEIERERRQIVHLRNRPGVLGEVERLDVSPAGLACLDADRGMPIGREGRKLVRVFFEAGGAEDPREEPLSSAKSADEGATGAFR